MSKIRTKAEAVKIIGELVDKELKDRSEKNLDSTVDLTDGIERIEHAWFIICRNMR